MGKVFCGARNSNWRGGRTQTQHGYILIRVGKSHHLSDVRGYAYEHRLVAEQKLGRRLKRYEEVHHLNQDRSDNRPENLEITADRADHAVRHRRSGKLRQMPDEPNPIVTCNCGCGSVFRRFDNSGRPRRFITGHNVRRNARGQFEVGHV